MKKLSTFIFCLLSLGTLVAQFQLDVEGDAKIRGKLDLQSGNENVFVGSYAGTNNTDGDDNSFFGYAAGTNNISGDDNSFFGSDAGFTNIDGDNNSFFGSDAGTNNISGAENAFFGSDAGFTNIDGDNNSFFGSDAGNSNTSGSFNSFFGRDAGFSNIDGDNNSFFGRNAGYNNTSGSKNAVFGVYAGSNNNNTRSTILGNNAQTTDSLDRAIAIGYEAQVACHNCAVIGGTGDNAVKMGIGTSMPLTDLHIKQSSEMDVRGIRLENDDDTNQWTTSIFFDNDYIFSYNNSIKSYINRINGAYVRNDLMPNLRSRNSRRIKENILDKLVALSVRQYPSPSPRNKTQKSLGFNTLEVQKLFPEVVREAEDGSLGMAYADFGILAIKAIQELVITVEEQENKNLTLAEENKLQNEQLNSQQTQIDELKSLVETLLTQNAETPKSTSYVLPIEQQALLAQNQPNPFRENTMVDYFVPAEVQNAHIQVTSLDGQVLGQVSITEKGKGQVTIQSKSYPAGTYFYSLVLDGQVMETKRMVLAR